LAGCKGYRWAISIAADPGAPQILPSPTQTTIKDLDSFKRPAAIAIRNAPVETTLWQIANLRLSSLYQESDRDYHLVLEGSAGHRLIAKVPFPACARTSVLLPDMTRVRSAINTRFGGVHGELHPNVVVSVRGVGFFDTNAIELDPLTAICFGPNCAIP
jgi:hypothetical protein